MKNVKISGAVIRRLSRYLRALEDLQQKGVERVSSADLSQALGFTASQIRQDLNHFGGFGQQGYGYNVCELHSEIEQIVGLDRYYSVVVVGCGRLGRAMANLLMTRGNNYEVTALFDISKDIVGQDFNGIRIRCAEGLADYLKEYPTDIAVITVTKDAAQSVADSLVEGGIKGIWNFALTDLQVGSTPIENVHLTDGLQTLIYYMNHAE